MESSVLKVSTPLETRKQYANELKAKYPEKVFVIMERSEHSLVPVLKNTKQLVSASLTVGEVENIIRRKLSVESGKAMFLFVNNTIPKKAALISAISEEYKDEDGFLYMTYGGGDVVTSLLCTLKTSLDIIGSILQEEEDPEFLTNCPKTWTRYLTVMKTVVALSESEKGVMEQVEDMIKSRKAALYSLVTLFSRVGDQNWVLKLSDCRNFQIRHHFVKLMFMETKTEKLHIEIDRSELLDQSILPIADATNLNGDISVSFNSEEALGEGVLLEWFYLICKELFDPDKKLFTVSPNDARRFRPNPASYVEIDHLKKIKFAGLIIALAIKHEIQIGILLDPIFFLSLSGKLVLWEDVRITDAIEHQSCSQILELSQEAFDAMELTFSVEIEEEKGKMVEVPLCENGESTVVSYNERDLYLNLRTEYLFVKLVKEQVLQFGEGFEKILSVDHKIFFNTIQLQDLDCMLRGEEHDTISINEWKLHTDYEYFEEEDKVIQWFWEVVNGMSEERQHNLLYFWTARKHLLMGGFEKLERLTISRQFGLDDTLFSLPRSQTCSSQLLIREYSSFEVMEQDFFYITTNSVGFGSY